VDLTLAVRFPHRQYHATPWDQAANSGVVEWPPSPWRLARALLSVWHTRRPQLDSSLVEGLVRVFGSPAEYQVPLSSTGHTRHYMPLLEHKTDEPGGTALTLDAYAGVSPADTLQITWRDVSLGADEFAVAQELWSLLPYLGRAESVCVAELSAGVALQVGGQPWLPEQGGSQQLMCVAPNATLAELEITPTAMRKSRSLMPAGAEWVAYRAGDELARPAPKAAAVPLVHVARWRLVSTTPFPETLGIWATDRLRWLTLQTIKNRAEPAAAALHGHLEDSSSTPHGHAHWLWVCADDSSAQVSSALGRGVQDLVVWVPNGVPGSLLTSMVSKRLTSPKWAPKGFIEADLALIGFGGSEVIDDLGSKTDASRWTSVTPFLMTRHMKPKRDFREVLVEDLSLELRYRFGDEAPQVTGLEIHSERRAEALAFRQQRIGHHVQSRGKSQQGKRGYQQSQALYLTIELSCDVRGPLLLGGQSHFGFGRFAAVP
jgi:CRISPR-associated protein Csb2